MEGSEEAKEGEKGNQVNDLLNPPLSPAEKAVEQALDLLREHFDACQILLNRIDEDGEHAYQDRSFGDADMRMGHVRRWLLIQEAAIKEHARIQVQEEEFDDGD